MKGLNNLPMPFSQVVAVFPPWIITSGLLSTKHYHFWVAFLTLFMEVIQWLCIACFCETGSVTHFAAIPWGERWLPSLLSAFSFSSQSWLLFYLQLSYRCYLQPSRRQTERRVSLHRYGCPPHPPVTPTPRERAFNRNSWLPSSVEFRDREVPRERG